MLSNYFANYDEFNAYFGKKENGQRKNKIFLAAYKYACQTKQRKAFESKCDCIETSKLLDILRSDTLCVSELQGENSELNGFAFRSKIYKIDDRKGVCDDGDFTAVRYINLESGKVFKMKAGKFIRAILQENGMIELYGETLCNYFCEQFAEEWKKINNSSNFTLNVDNDFRYIYDRGNCIDSSTFGSCMANKFQYVFYENSVNALAASLINKNDEIVARCIVFTEVLNEADDTILRLAERQYADKDLYKQILVDKLITEKQIDGYKKIGTGCGDAKEFVLNSGESLNQCALSISCCLDDEDTISYQDSFKYFNIDRQRAYNYYCDDYTHALDTTNQYLSGENYDEYNERYTDDEITTIYYWNESCKVYLEMSCSLEYAQDNLYWIEHLDAYATDYYYSEAMDAKLPLDKWDEIEDEWKENNWYYDEYNEEYVESVTECFIWDRDECEYVSRSVCADYARNNFYEYDDEYYDEVNEYGEPYHLAEELQTA